MGERRRKGILIAFEGIDGAGKTTQARALVSTLEAEGHRAVYTKEPTHGVWGEAIRRSSVAGRMPVEQELHAFMEDRKEHVRDVIKPALERGDAVVVDRYFVSSAAYQGARGIDPEKILRENEGFAPIPDVVFLLVVPAETGMERVQRRGVANLFERKEYLDAVAAVFAGIDRPYVRRIDGTQPQASITRTICDEVLHGRLLKGREG